MRRGMIITLTALCVAFTGCGKASAEAVKPLMGIDWFTGYDDVKNALENYTLLNERESNEQKIPQKMQDYTGIDLFDYSCDLTLCFTDSGLIGFNYHDIERNQNYKDWYSTLEKNYGLPTEEGSGMASWYDNPAGKNTAIYLFNLEEGVQISFYATADSPDKTYKRENEIYVPTPEIRTPVVPVTNEPATFTTTNDVETTNETAGETTVPAQLRMENTATDMTENAFLSDTGNFIMTDAEEAPIQTDIVTDTAGNITTGTVDNTPKDRKSATVAQTTAKISPSSTTVATTAVVETQEEETEPKPVERTNDFKLNGLQFYGTPDSEREKMRNYTQLYEYRTEESGQPWELIMEYENVSYLGKNCDGVLCFTSLGLVGINYFDGNTSNYNFWMQTLTDIYGSPDEMQYDYMAWNQSPVGNGTMIYLFLLEDGVQLSFFADDTGSELA